MPANGQLNALLNDYRRSKVKMEFQNFKFEKLMCKKIQVKKIEGKKSFKNIKSCPASMPWDRQLNALLNDH